jgi:hypothetical protein
MLQNIYLLSPDPTSDLSRDAAIFPIHVSHRSPIALPLPSLGPPSTVHHDNSHLLRIPQIPPLQTRPETRNAALAILRIGLHPAPAQNAERVAVLRVGLDSRASPFVELDCLKTGHGGRLVQERIDCEDGREFLVEAVELGFGGGFECLIRA